MQAEAAPMEGDGNTAGKRKGEAKEHGGSSAKRLACSIESCDYCEKKILKPPIFQVNSSYLVLSFLPLFFFF
jgi:hypothetical protein